MSKKGSCATGLVHGSFVGNPYFGRVSSGVRLLKVRPTRRCGSEAGGFELRSSAFSATSDDAKESWFICHVCQGPPLYLAVPSRPLRISGL